MQCYFEIHSIAFFVNFAWIDFVSSINTVIDSSSQIMNNYGDFIWLLIAVATRSESFTDVSDSDRHDNSDDDKWWKQGRAVCEREGWQTGFNEHGRVISGENGNEGSIYLCKGYVPIS